MLRLAWTSIYLAYFLSPPILENRAKVTENCFIARCN
jgi:hypothetical protein